MKDKNIFLKILGYFSIWRIILFLVAILAGLIIANFGNRFPYVDRVLTITNLPNWIWGFGNFDGVHYLRLAQNGYDAQFSQAFFPLYPLLIKFLNFLPKGNYDLSLFVDPSYFYVGLILSNILFVIALFFLYKLWTIEYDSKITKLATILLLTFPTSYYFGAIYSESLFLLLAVLTFWFVRKDKFILAGIMTALASATKIQGVLLAVFILIELWYKYKTGIKTRLNSFWKDVVGLLIAPLGLATYMLYLWKQFGDPIYFLTSQPAFGAGRSNFPFVTLPQVIYRYLKMLLTVGTSNLAFWNATLELFFMLLPVGILIYSFRKVKFSYWMFTALAILMPTLTGTLSSMPRYAILAFPLIPLIAKFNKGAKYIIIAQVLVGVVLLAMFIRGYWVA